MKNEKITAAVEEIIAHAKKNAKVFLFGDEVYTPEEAHYAMLETATMEIAETGMTVEEYIDRQRGCMVDAD